MALPQDLPALGSSPVAASPSRHHDRVLTLASHRPAAIPVRSRWVRRYSRAVAVGDVVALGMAAAVACLVVTSGPAGRLNRHGLAYASLSIGLVVALVVGLGAAHTRHRRVIGSGPTEYTRVSTVAFQLLCAVVAVSYLLSVHLSRAYLITVFALGLTLLLASRYVARGWLVRRRMRGGCMNAVLVVGTRASATSLAESLGRDLRAGLMVVGFCLPGGRPENGTSVDGIPVLGDVGDAARIARAADVTIVAVTGCDGTTPASVRQLGWDLEGTGVDLVLAPALLDVAGPRIVTSPVNGTSLLHVDLPRFAGSKYWAKSVFDLVVAAIVTVALLPVLVVVAALVKLSGPGPVIFVQERVGLDGNVFRMFKFRSMRTTATSDHEVLEGANDGAGVLFKLHDDPRVTRVGRVLRRYSLDELPQIFNVLRGDMSLVGPRPPLPSEVDRYEDNTYRRLLVKPGITGLWQISGRSDLTWRETVRLDLYYTENWTLLGDLLILLRTARTVVTGAGAY